jgi:hypothetical protein
MSQTRIPPPPFWRTPYYEANRFKPGRAAIIYDDVALVLRSAIRREQQADGRVRYWGWVPRFGRWLRVVTLEDGAVHNAFFDRSFKP